MEDAAMPPRSISTASMTFGLVSIPVRLFPATSSRTVRFNLLHAKDKSRIQEKIFCPTEEKIIDRSELVRGYEVEKGRYVTFTDEELKQLEAQADHAIEIAEFIPVSEVDPVYFENSYLLGCEPTSAKAYHLLKEAMAKANRVGIAKFTMRGKERLVLIRPFDKGLMLHTMYYEDEVRSFKEIDNGADTPVKENELSLAQRLIADLTEKKFNPQKYKDTYRERVIAAAEQKLAGHEVTESAPEARKGQVIDLMSALKQSLKKRGVAIGADEKEQEDSAEPEERKTAQATRRAARSRRAR
ncbi:MAG: non-homologous end joining protein Ku [Candidatus Binataceae bacterium]